MPPSNTGSDSLVLKDCQETSKNLKWRDKNEGTNFGKVLSKSTLSILSAADETEHLKTDKSFLVVKNLIYKCDFHWPSKKC